jgi:hypothetical protein
MENTKTRRITRQGNERTVTVRTKDGDWLTTKEYLNARYGTWHLIISRRHKTIHGALSWASKVLGTAPPPKEQKLPLGPPKKPAKQRKPKKIS